MEPHKDCEEIRQRKTWYMKKMKSIAYWMCKNQAILKRFSVFHKDFKLTTKMQGSEYHQTARNFPDYEKNVSLTRFSGLLQKFQADDKNVSLIRSSDLSHSFQAETRMWASQYSQACHKNFKLTTGVCASQDSLVCHNNFKLTTRIESHKFLRMSWEVQACDSTMILTRFSDCNETFKRACTRH
jgi:hypothetical protein